MHENLLDINAWSLNWVAGDRDIGCKPGLFTGFNLLQTPNKVLQLVCEGTFFYLGLVFPTYTNFR